MMKSGNSAPFPSFFIAHVYIGWPLPIAQQIVSYCTEFNKNITERSTPQIQVRFGGMFWKNRNMYSNSSSDQTVISFESPAGEEFLRRFGRRLRGTGGLPSNLARC